MSMLERGRGGKVYLELSYSLRMAKFLSLKIEN